MIYLIRGRVDDERKKQLRQRVQEAAQRLEGRLPPSPRHPRGRNPHAHVAQVIKGIIGMSYTVAPDELYDDIIAIIDYCERNPF
jgi:hypothetical protein